MWTLRNVISTNEKYDDVYWTQVRRWFVIEQLMLFGCLVSGLVFLILSYCLKSSSFWNNNRPRFIVLKDKIIQNVWRERNSSDFLQYLKFEFI